VHALLGEMSERDELVLGRQAKLEPRRPQAKAVERREIYCRTLT
jgi:hypothetical protein